jgi:imidazolonepropionase-like amidohydrolase
MLQDRDFPQIGYLQRMKAIRTLPILFYLLVAGCAPKDQTVSNITAFTGATIVDGSGGAPVADGVLLVQGQKVVAVGSRADVSIPQGATVVDVTGKTIVPGIINSHGHVGETKGIDGGHYSRENVIDNLAIYARYGVTTVVSLGGNNAEAEPVGAVNDTAVVGHARLFMAGEVITGKTPEEALPVIDRNHAMGVDFMKIRVDDNLGTAEKMSEEVYRAVIQHTHELGYKIATHMYYLDDARKLLDAGTDMLAHSVRDVPVDEAFIEQLKARGIGYCPTLTREISTFVYGDTAKFFTDPFFLREYSTELIQPLLDPERQAQVSSNKNGQTYREHLPIAMATLKTLSDRGIPILFGTDSGIPTRFKGYFEHLELEMMAEAGLTPMQIIVAASRDAAKYMGLQDLGTLSPGHYADFIILDANPLEDIKNMREIDRVFVGGMGVER